MAFSAKLWVRLFSHGLRALTLGNWSVYLFLIESLGKHDFRLNFVVRNLLFMNDNFHGFAVALFVTSHAWIPFHLSRKNIRRVMITSVDGLNCRPTTMVEIFMRNFTATLILRRI